MTTSTLNTGNVEYRKYTPDSGHRPYEVKDRVSASYSDHRMSTQSYPSHKHSSFEYSKSSSRTREVYEKHRSTSRVCPNETKPKHITSLSPSKYTQNQRDIQSFLCNRIYPPSFEELISVFANRSSEMNGANIATAIHRIAKNHQSKFFDLSQEEKSSLQKILVKCCLEHKKQFNEQELSNVFWAFAKLGIHDKQLFFDLGVQASKIVSEFNAQEIANTLWAFSKLGIENKQLFLDLGAHASKIASTFNAQHIANTLWAFATFGIEDKQLFLDLGAHASEIASTFKAQEIANTLWAFSKLDIEDEDLFLNLGAYASEIASTFKAQEIANTLWAFSKLGIENKQLFLDLGAHASKIVSEFNAQGIANTLWAFAKLDIEDKQLFLDLGAHASEIASTFKAQEIANTLWAFFKLGIEDKQLFLDLGAHASKIVSTFKAQDVANTLWAFANLGIENKQLCLDLGTRASKIVSTFNAQDIANTLWAFAKFGIENKQLFLDLGAHASKIVSTFTAQGIANTLWAFANLGIENKQLCFDLGTRASKIVSTFNAQDIANTLWAFAIKETSHDDIDSFVSKFIDRYSILEFSYQEIPQVYFFLKQYKRTLEIGTKIISLLPVFYEKIRSNPPHSSEIQKKIYNHLEAYFSGKGIRCKLEYFCKSVGYYFDIALPDHKIAIEIDGPDHFLSNGDLSPVDIALDKVKCKNGWKVIRIDIRGKSDEKLFIETQEAIETLLRNESERQVSSTYRA